MPRGASMGEPIAVYLEVGKQRVFACSVDWPGWCRSGRDEAEALSRLADYTGRYRPVAVEAGIRFPAGEAIDLDVVERIRGSATTDFGAPGEIPSLDAEPVSSREATRIAALVSAAWTELDRVAASAPAELRKGPRGGGRDRDKMLDHVLGAEVSYARKLGVKHPQPRLDDQAGIDAFRSDLIAVIGRAWKGSPPAERGWPPRYLARRIAWHVLDHAWEMEDRSAVAG